MFCEKFLEIFLCDTGMYLIVNLYGNTDTVAFTDAEAARKRDIVTYARFLYGFLQKFHDLGRPLQITGASDANLYNHYLIPLRARWS